MYKYYLESHIRNGYGTLIFYYNKGDWFMELDCCVSPTSRSIVSKNTVIDVLSSGGGYSDDNQLEAMKLLRSVGEDYHDCNLDVFGEDFLRMKGVVIPEGYKVDFDCFSDVVYSEIEVYNPAEPDDVVLEAKYPLGDIEYLVNTLELL